MSWALCTYTHNNIVLQQLLINRFTEYELSEFSPYPSHTQQQCPPQEKLSLAMAEHKKDIVKQIFITKKPFHMYQTM